MKRKIIFLASLAITSLVLASCNEVAKENPLEAKIINDNNDVFYEIFVGSYSDSNGDGYGDLRGLINRLDYLNDGDPNSGESLGVTGLWLMPIFKSYSYHKYDVVDYYTVDSKYGTNDDLKELLEKCHERGMKVILDLPINHTSSSNQWFIDFRNAIKNNDFDSDAAKMYSYYTRDNLPAGKTTSLVPGTTNYFYECNFSTDMPELNYDNEIVRTETLNIGKYWLDLGCDGFRFDGAKYIYLNEDNKNVEFWKWYTDELKKVKSDIYTVGEVWSGDQIIEKYYDAFTCFDFSFSGAEGLIAGAANRKKSMKTYVNALISYKNTNAGKILAPFICNHDMDRAAGFVNLSSGNAYTAASLLILTSGSPFIYYGDEIGMKGSRGGANTDANRRLAMLWGDGDTVKDPSGATYSIDSQVNGTVVSQLEDDNSLYNHYRKLIMMRNANPEIARGDYEALSINSTTVGGFKATYNDNSVLVIHNSGTEEAVIELDDYKEFKVLNSYSGLGSASLNGSSLTISGQTSVILRLK